MSLTSAAARLAQTQIAYPLPATVIGTGLYIPDIVVTNAQLAETLNTTDDWIVSHTGIRQRHHLASDLAASDMGLAAARPALEMADLAAADLDAIIVASYTYDQPLPSTALIIADALGADRALPVDLTQAACASGVQAVLLGAQLMASPAFSNVLIVAADCASRVTDPSDRTTRIFFGDAAAAVVLSRSDGGTGLLSFDYGCQLSYAVQIPAGGSRRPASAATLAARQHYLVMDGREVWNVAVKRLPDSIALAANRAGLAIGEIDHFFLHQANLNMLTLIMDQLGIPAHRVPITVDKLGNTGSAGMFTALHQAHVAGRLKPGDHYILSAIGAGFQWGSLCLRHGCRV